MSGEVIGICGVVFDKYLHQKLCSFDGDAESNEVDIYSDAAAVKVLENSAAYEDLKEFRDHKK